MDPNLEEALSLKSYAEQRFAERDFVGARYYASKAQMLYPGLDGLSQMVATFGIYAASDAKIGGEVDFYAILGLDPSVDKAKLKKQYRKMAVLLHPDKNKTVGADGAFKLISDAWTILSDSVKRNVYDHRRKYCAGHTTGASDFDSYSNTSASHHGLDTFWTICTSCHVQYEYQRKYVNKRLSCKNCRGIFIAAETGLAPVNGSFPYNPWTYVAENGYGSHGSKVTYVPSSSAYGSGNGISGHHSVPGSEYVSNLSFQWNSIPEMSAGVLDHNGLSTTMDATYQVNGKPNKTNANLRHQSMVEAVDMASNGVTMYTEPPATKAIRRPYKQRRVDSGSYYRIDNSEGARTSTVCGNGNPQLNPRVSALSDDSARRFSSAPAFDARQLLIDKARTVIRKKLEEIKATAEAEKRKRAQTDVHGSSKENGPMAISVPDSDFHDFDKDRTEDCFKPKQIWALYDEEDGMPRLYCLIRDIISLKPFKIYISYLSSKTDTEFGSVNWLDSGFTKSCGNFRVFNSDIVDQVNIFSHLLGREKAGRGGCVRIYPRRGDIWAVYRNWSPNWNRKTPVKERHQYEMVEVLDDYSEELGVCVAPLTKLDGFKTVYQRNPSKDAIRWIPRRAMLCFSHPVPSCLLKGDLNLPDGCWDLDPAATPDELLQLVTESPGERSPTQKLKSDATALDSSRGGTSSLAEENTNQTVNSSATPNDCSQFFHD